MKKNSQALLILITTFLVTFTGNAQISTLFSDDFSSTSFSSNGWTFPNGQGNWTIGNTDTPSGGSAPNAYFNWASVALNYTYALQSGTIYATSINGPVTLDYLLLVNPNNVTSTEYVDVEYKDVSSSTWTLLATYTNSANSAVTYTSTNMILPGMSGQAFQIQFKVYGANSINVFRWSLDNVIVKGTTCPTAIPTVSISGSPTVCANSSTTLTAIGGGATYSWFPPAGNGSIAIVSPTSNVTYSLVSSYNGCLSTPATSTHSLTVFTNTTAITATTSQSVICAGASVSLSASSSATLAWSNSVTTNSQVVSPTVTTNYSVSTSNTLGCLAIKVLTIHVNPLPPVTALATNTLICSGNTNTLTASGALSYTWSTGATTSLTSLAITTSTTYTVSGSDLQNCIASAVVSVGVLPPIVIVSSGSLICPGTTANLISSGASSYTWSTGSNSPFISVSPSVTNTYTVVGTQSIGCTTSATYTIIVNPNPTVTAMGSQTAVCAGKTATLIAAGASTYTWSTQQSGPTITVSPLSMTIYSVAGTSSAACTGSNNTASVTLIVNSNPTLVSSSSSSSICLGHTLSLNASGANSYTWEPGNILQQSVVVQPSANTVFTVTGTNSLLCASSQTIGVIVHPLPVLTISSNTTDLCIGSSATMIATGAASYSWNTGSLVNIIYESPQTTTTYSVNGMSAQGCVNSKTIEITVHNYPLVVVSSADSIICSGESVLIEASGAANYTWSNGETGTAITVSPSATSIYTVTGISNGCATSAQVTQHIEECTSLDKLQAANFLPTIFPNPGTGKFILSLPYNNTTCEVEIFDLGGQLIVKGKLTRDEASFDISGYPDGFYLVRITAAEKKVLLKIIKI
ncbi:hypothetical protein CNR22_24295 [Sphingobacteriaceae bacterium]|nr:hypothetical protein CNR22_00055 [Sphingobacteriaceae bacterium]PBQ34762.1 hypothetical protein CNR22_24295 [Sphingobacteriaceae bacterium]